MNKKDIVLFSIVLIYIGYRLYQKYIKKEQMKPENKGKSDTSLTTFKDDDYEPYSKK
jgi:carbon starvation protein CstA